MINKIILNLYILINWIRLFLILERKVKLSSNFMLEGRFSVNRMVGEILGEWMGVKEVIEKNGRVLRS